MASPQKETEIKVHCPNVRSFANKLRDAGFRMQTRRTHEMNTLFDTPARSLRRKGEVLRIRKYGTLSTVTHKVQAVNLRHKTRAETETTVADGDVLAQIFLSLGYVVSFRYEKFRAEWTDGTGHVVIDETPIGNFLEIEGAPKWIDATAKKLGIAPADYLVSSYAELFLSWKRKHRHTAEEMTWKAVGKAKK